MSQPAAPSRAELITQAERIIRHPIGYLACCGCDSLYILGQGLRMVLCPRCHAFRFTTDPPEVKAAALTLKTRLERTPEHQLYP